MDYAPLVDRLAGEGAAAWNIHFDALAAKERGEDVIVLSVGDPDLDTPAPIVDRAVQALRGGDTHYASLIGEPALRRAIAADFHTQGGWNADIDNVCVVAGAQTGLFFATMLLTRPGDEVIVLTPTYVTYEATVRASGAEPVLVECRGDAGFRPDPAAIEAAVTPRTRAILFANPNNPTGVALRESELAGLADIARRHDLWVIADEVYSALTYGVSHQPISALPGMAERSVTVSSLSKSHAMTGWRVGWMIGPETLIGHAQNLALVVVYGLPGFVQQAAVTALEQAAAITDEMRAVYSGRRDLMLHRLSNLPGLRPVGPEAGMFLMLEVADTGLSGAEFARRLLDEQGVSVLDASAFGPGGNGYVRLSYTVSETQLTEACRRIAAFAEQLSPAAERAHG